MLRECNELAEFIRKKHLPEGIKYTKVHLYVLILEDRRFFCHFGFDVIAVARVLLLSMMARKLLGGASTIEQQLVRTITGRKDISFRRKIKEILLAICISFKIPKMVLLNVYGDIAYVGYNITGLRGAANFLFHKEIEDLDDVQSSIVASTLLNPIPRYASEKWRNRILKRAAYARDISAKGRYRDLKK